MSKVNSSFPFVTKYVLTSSDQSHSYSPVLTGTPCSRLKPVVEQSTCWLRIMQRTTTSSIRVRRMALPLGLSQAIRMRVSKISGILSALCR